MGGGGSGFCEIVREVCHENESTFGGSGDAFFCFQFHEEVVKINLYEALKKSEARTAVESLFTVKPFVADIYKEYAKKN